MNLLKVFHTWLGAAFSLLVLLSSVTGTLLVWKQEYVLWRLPEVVEAFDPSLEHLAAIGEAIEVRFDNNNIVQIQFATENFPYTKVILADNHYAYINPQGMVVDQWLQNERFEEWLYDLHHRLLLENLGLTLLGLAALALILLVVAGVVAYWPLRRAFKRGVWPKGVERAQLLAAHRNSGIVVALPLLLILVTAVILAFPIRSEQWLLEPFRGDDYSVDFAEQLDDISGGNSGDWLPALRRSLRTFPGARVRTATVPNAASPYRIIGLQQPGELHPGGNSKVYIEAAGGWMDVRIDATAQHVSERIYHLTYPLHTGRMDAVLYKVMLSAIGCAVAFLSVLALVSFIQRFIPRRFGRAAADGVQGGGIPE